MNLIFENWNKFLNEEKTRTVILNYIEENNIQLTEQQIEEGMPKWLRNMVATGMLITTAAGVLAPNPAKADEWANMFDQAATEKQAEAPDADASADIGTKVAPGVFDKIKDSIPEGSKINLNSDTLPSADLNPEGFGNSLLNSLQDLLANKNVEVLDKGIGSGIPANDADGNLTVSIMDQTDGEYTIQLSGGGAFENINVMYKVK
jgi:hypothetical protein